MQKPFRIQNQTIRDDFRTSEPTNTKTPDNRSPTEPKTQNTKKNKLQTKGIQLKPKTKNKLKSRGFQKLGSKTNKNKNKQLQTHGFGFGWRPFV